MTIIKQKNNFRYGFIVSKLLSNKYFCLSSFFMLSIEILKFFLIQVYLMSEKNFTIADKNQINK
jgi:hypothetical protein